MIIEHELMSKAITGWRFLYKRGFIEGFGHLSARLPDSDLFLITRHSLGSRANEDDFVILDLKGRKLHGKGNVPGEFPIHSEIYKARADVGSVVHYHGMYSTAFTATTLTLRPIHLLARMFSDGIPVYPDSRPVQDSERGAAVAQTLGAHRALLMQAHGATVVGPDIEQAIGATFAFEQNAHRAYLSASMGQPLWLDDRIAAEASLAPAKERGPFARIWAMAASDEQDEIEGS